jgi:putative membrane protein
VGGILAKVNAALNFTALLLLLVGYGKIRSALRSGDAGERAGYIAQHERFMKLAFLTSALFLISYLTRYYLTGSHAFPGSSLVRTVYLIILISHMILAAATVPLVLRTLFLAHQKRFAKHRGIARWTFPIWLYVSVTGVVVYVLLYHVAPLIQ